MVLIKIGSHIYMELWKGVSSDSHSVSTNLSVLINNNLSTTIHFHLVHLILLLLHLTWKFHASIYMNLQLLQLWEIAIPDQWSRWTLPSPAFWSLHFVDLLMQAIPHTSRYVHNYLACSSWFIYANYRL